MLPAYRALDQQYARGLTALDSEFWVENLMQRCKSTVKYRARSNPEVLLVNSLMQQHALAMVRRDNGFRDGKPYVQWYDERLPQYRNADLQVEHADAGASNGSQLLGKGTVPKPAVQKATLASLKLCQSQYSSVWKSQGWTEPLKPEDVLLMTYKRAQLGESRELLLSESCQLSKTRVSYYAAVHYLDEGMYIARIKYFVKVHNMTPATAATPSSLRYAIADLYATQALPDPDGILGTCFAVTIAECKKPSHCDYAVLLDDLQGKVMWAEPAQHVGDAGTIAGLYVQYPNMRQYLDPYAAAAADANESDSEDEDAAAFA